MFEEVICFEDTDQSDEDTLDRNTLQSSKIAGRCLDRDRAGALR